MNRSIILKNIHQKMNIGFLTHSISNSSMELYKLIGSIVKRENISEHLKVNKNDLHSKNRYFKILHQSRKQLKYCFKHYRLNSEKIDILIEGLNLDSEEKQLLNKILKISI